MIQPAIDLCQLAIDEQRMRATWPGAPQLAQHRIEILGRARATPVVFARSPEDAPLALEEARALRRALAREPDKAGALYQLLRATRRNYALRRQLLLREGYLYSDEPELALRLSQVVRLDHLFDDASIFLQRGAETLRAELIEGRYYWSRADDRRTLAEKSRRPRAEANLLLFDRVWSTNEAPGVAIHADFARLRGTMHFDSLRVEHINETTWIVAFTTGGIQTQGLVRVEDGEARLECEVHPPDLVEQLGSERTERARREQLLAPILQATTEIVERRLPFDEPRTEEGQQDGLLRIHFRKAFREGQRTYEFNGDRYFVFDGFGRPLLPEVCIDFITDAIDWGTGGSWSERGQKRRRVRGALSFDSFGLANPRSVEQVADFAAARPAWFDMVFLEPAQRVKFLHRARFFEQLATDRELYQRGDIVFILGLRDDEKFHYHSFFVQEVDPVSGTPTLLAANAGPPQLRTWEGEMSNAPRRSIVARLRLRTSLLAQAATQAENLPGVPLEPPAPIEEGLELPETPPEVLGEDG